MNPIIITDPKTINADLACMGLTELREHAARQSSTCAIDRARARIRDYVARIG